MKQNEYSVAPFSDETYLLGYEASNPKLTRNYKASDISGGGGLNIYNSNGTLIGIGDRFINQDSKRVFFYDGKVFFGTNDPEWLIPGFEIPVPFQFNGGLIAGNGGITCQPVGGGDGFLMNPGGDGNAYTARMDDSNTFGLNLKAGFNKIFDANISPDPSNENSSIFTIWSTRKGAITAPRMTKAQREAIVSPSNFLEVNQIDTVGLSLAGKYIFLPEIGWDRFKTASE